jgi:hypothetical protein
MTAVYRQICGYGQLLASPGSQQGAVVANTQAEAAFLAEAGGVGRTLANLNEKGEFASFAAGFGMGLFHPHLMTLNHWDSDVWVQRMDCFAPILPLERQSCLHQSC